MANDQVNDGENIFESIELLKESNIISYNIEDGLISNHVYAISQDNLGYIWIATEAGLSRFNGKEFYNFTTKNGLRRNETVDLFRTKNRRIWMASNGPLGYIENGEIGFLDVDIKVDLSWNYSAYENEDSLWIAFERYFYLIDKTTNEVKSLNEIHSLNRSKIILNYYNNQLFVFSADTVFGFVNENLVFKTPINLKESKTYRIMFANYKNGFFCIRKEQLFYFDFLTKKTQNYDVDVTDAQRLRLFDNELFITYSTGGLKSIHIQNNMDVIEETKTNTGIIYTDIFRDKDSNFWLGTSAQGVIFLPKRSDKIKSKSVIENVKLSELNCALIDGDAAWIGTRKGELILINNGEIQVKTLPNKNPNGKTRINDIVKLNSGKFLISSDAGLYFFDKNEFTHIFYGALKKISVVGDNIYLNTHKNILNTNEDCLVKISADNKNDTKANISYFIQKNDCLKEISLNRSHQTMFIDNKVFVYEPNTGFVSYTLTNSKLTDRKIIKENVGIRDLYHYKNYIFIATIGEGILNYDLHTEEIKTIKGLSSTIVYSLDVDSISSVMYAGSNSGIHIIQLNDEGIEDHVAAINKNDGLLSSEIQDVIQTDTTIIAISDKGINNINKNFKTDKKLPNFKIEQFKVNNKELPLKASYKLKSNQKNITIQFNKIDFNDELNSWFAYKKDGSDWEETNNNSLNFDDVKPGEHKISLGLIFSQNEIPKKIEEISFYIEQKFHQTIFAKLIAGLAALIMIFLVGSYFLSQQNLKVLENLVVNRTKQLQLKMGELDEANDKLKIKNKNLNSYTYLVSHDLKAPLYNISSFLKIISEKNKNKFDNTDKEYFNNIDYGLKSMLNKINDLLKYSKVNSDVDLKLIEPICLNEVINVVKKDFEFEIDKQGIQFVIEQDLPKLKLEKTSAHLLFQNLISNSIKYNQSTTPIIEIGSRKVINKTILLVKDNGIGISQNYQSEAFDIFSRGHNNATYEGTGIGLAICKKIVEAHNGHIELESEENIGTVFSLIFHNIS